MSETLKRHLKQRHITMIALGGSIGTGIFVASGNAIHTAGPGGAIAAYLLIAAMVYFLMSSLGEMSALIPVTGTFCDYSSRFVEPAFGFAMSYNYWFNWAITVAVELSSAGFIMKFWFPEVPLVLWSALFFAIVVGLNLLTVRFFGETEYWLSLIKIIAIVVFIIIGTMMIMGFFNHSSIKLSNWTMGDAPFHQGWIGFLCVMMVAGFSFQGTEIFGVTAGEAENPRETIPKAVKNVFWRILLFYILSMVIISFVIPYTDPRLINTNTDEVALSPFTIVFRNAGLHAAASVMNGVILVAVISACNASLYTATRMLWHIAKQKQAPAVFAKLSPQRIPLNALLATAAVGSLVFLSSIFGNGQVFMWLLNISSLAGFIAWFGIAVSHYRFRRAYLVQGYHLRDLPYQSPFFPFAPIFTVILCVLIILGQQLNLLLTHNDSWVTVIGTYIGIPIFLLFYLGYKWRFRSKLIPLEQCELQHQE